MGLLEATLISSSVTEAIRRDVNEMYRQLGQNMVVPEEKFKVILAEVTERLRQAFTQRITPGIICNRITATELASPADHNWNQPLSLLLHSARVLRETQIHPSRFTKFAFKEDDFSDCLDVFGDIIFQRKPDVKLAKYGLTQIEMISNSLKPAKEKCREIWSLITGKPVPGSDDAPSQLLKSEA